jgi:excinuclease UvrABC helicase subunit UvrB
MEVVQMDKDKYLYFRANVITNGQPNVQGDVFQLDESQVKAFIGKPISYDFRDDDVNKMIGVVVDSFKNGDSIEVLSAIDKNHAAAKMVENNTADISYGYRMEENGDKEITHFTVLPPRNQWNRENPVNHEKLKGIKHDLEEQSALMMTRSDLSPYDILNVIKYLEEENRKLSLQVVNLTSQNGLR